MSKKSKTKPTTPPGEKYIPAVGDQIALMRNGEKILAIVTDSEDGIKAKQVIGDEFEVTGEFHDWVD